MVTDVDVVETPVLPMALLVQAGLSASFEQLSQPFASDLIEQRARDRSERIEQLLAEVETERRALAALSALQEFLEPDPAGTVYRKIEAH